MKVPKKQPRKQLEKFTTVFTQLGLVLVLTVVYFTMEHQTLKDKSDERVSDVIPSSEITLLEDIPIVFRTEVEKTKKTTPIKRKKIDITKIKKVDDITVITKVIDLPTTDNTSLIDITKLPEKYEDDIDKGEDPVFMTNIQNAPVFKGCEGLNEKEGRKCLEKKINRHVQRYFNPEIAQNLGMNTGKYKIFTQFVIDKSGDIIDLKIRGPHKSLEKEAQKVVNKIPKFTPGKQNNKPVKVKYTLPIVFHVE